MPAISGGTKTSTANTVKATSTSRIATSRWRDRRTLRCSVSRSFYFVPQGAAERLGRVAAGYEADIVLLRGNPLVAIEHSLEVQMSATPKVAVFTDQILHH